MKFSLFLLVIYVFCSIGTTLTVNKDDELHFTQWLRERQMKSALLQDESSYESKSPRKFCLPYSTCPSEIDQTVSVVLALIAISCFFGYYQCYECQKTGQTLDSFTRPSRIVGQYQRVNFSPQVSVV